jgi:hypothetical protein
MYLIVHDTEVDIEAPTAAFEPADSVTSVV